MNEMSFEERLLEGAAASMTYPATPQLRGRVVSAISAPAPRRVSPSLRRALVLSMAAAAAVVVAVVLGVPASRTAVAKFFHIQGSKIERLPTPRPGETPTPFPTPAGLESEARRVSLDEAARVVRFQPLLPSDDDPLATYIAMYGDQPVVVLHYDRFDLWEARTVGFFRKDITAEQTLDTPMIKARGAQYISGGNHIVQYFNEFGTPVEGSQRTVDRSTMIWNDGTTFFRLETDLSEADAIKILESLR
jgi:hypothetical protein